MASSKSTRSATEFHHPWGMTFISPDELLITERRGRLWRFNLKTLQRKEIVGLPIIQAQGQGGLLDVEISPTLTRTKEFSSAIPAEHLNVRAPM